MEKPMFNVESHLIHCDQGEYIGSCKYGEDETCAALLSRDVLPERETNMEYTKGKWKAVGRRIILDHPQWSDDKKEIASCNEWLNEESEANAQRIAKAVNSYDAMYEALKRILDDRNSALAREAGHKALALARGE